MSSLVNDFIINPVLRQARRFSEASRTTLAGGGNEPSDPQPEAVIDSDSSHHAPPSTGSITPAEPSEPPELLEPRPLSSSTQETRVGEAMASPMSPTVDDGTPRDHLGFPLSPKRGTQIPEDDGMRELRARIQAVHARELPQEETARLMHQILLEGYHAAKGPGISSPDWETMPSPASQTREEPTPHGPLESLRFWPSQLGESIEPEKFIMTEDDLKPTYAPIRRNKGQYEATTPGTNTDSTVVELTHPPLGCQHYERNVKLQCASCNKWYPCRLCHDAEEDHKLPRFETKHMLCMLCGTPQKASDVCIACDEISAQYYCNICKLWENRQSKPIYHCHDCGICRRGLGLGKDYVHCKTCCACIPTSIETSHKCIERSTDCNCPICGEYMFTSPRPVVFMSCGHSIHKKCYDQHMRASYKCPICNKSLANMETQFRNLDLAIHGQPMPAEFQDTKAIILCNDCSGRSTVPYHWLGLKCRICLSYNTVELQILGGGSQELQGALAERNNETVEGESQQAVANEPAAGARDAPTTAGRRRHSSRGVEIQRRASEIIAGSYPPISTRLGPGLGQIESDTESEDGILGFWGASANDDDDDEEDYDDEGSEEDSDDDGDDDDDEENELILIGHR